MGILLQAHPWVLTMGSLLPKESSQAAGRLLLLSLGARNSHCGLYRCFSILDSSPRVLGSTINDGAF